MLRTRDVNEARHYEAKAKTRSRSAIDFTRRNAVKLAKPRVLCDRYRNFFPVRVINSWSSLPDNIMSSVMVFKAGVSKLHFCGHCSC